MLPPPLAEPKAQWIEIWGLEAHYLENLVQSHEPASEMGVSCANKIREFNTESIALLISDTCESPSMLLFQVDSDEVLLPSLPPSLWVVYEQLL